LVCTEEFLVTYCSEHFREDLACEDGVFGVCYFGDLFLFSFAVEAFCLCVVSISISPEHHVGRAGLSRERNTRGYTTRMGCHTPYDGIGWDRMG